MRTFRKYFKDPISDINILTEVIEMFGFDIENAVNSTKENYDSTIEVTFRALEDYKNFIKQQELKKRQELIEKVKKVIDYE